MSERERDRRLSVDNRLEELRSRYGRELEDRPLPPILDHLPLDHDEWMEQVKAKLWVMMEPEAYAHLLELHESMLALERSRYGGELSPPEPEAAPPAPVVSPPPVWRRAT